jgi:hypothetical protein
MTRSNLLALAALAILGVGTAAVSRVEAAPATAPFGCDARAGQTCFFKIFYGPRATRIVQLRAGMKDKIPGVEIGRDSYCVDVNRPPVYRCTHKTINATYNN